MSELWHAQSVFFGSYYINEKCPLVSHVVNSYFKHYIDDINDTNQNITSSQDTREQVDIGGIEEKILHVGNENEIEEVARPVKEAS